MSRKKTMGIFAFVAIAALLTLGIGYASWTDQLNLNGTVHTGTFQVQMSNAAAKTAKAAPGNAATCTPSFASDHTLNIAVQYAYPGYECDVTFTITNSGTVPVQLDSANSTNLNGPIYVENDGSLKTASDSNSGVEFNGTCTWGTGVIAPNGTVSCTISGVVLTGAVTSGTYSLSSTIAFMLPASS